jgi:hypothetical protein
MTEYERKKMKGCFENLKGDAEIKDREEGERKGC